MCKIVTSEDRIHLLGEKWDTIEGEQKNDIYKCNIIESTTCLKYAKAHVTLYIRFSYARRMMKNNVKVPFQAKENAIASIPVCVRLPNGVVETISASTHWSLLKVREHLNIVAIEDLSSAMFGISNRKIRAWMEPKIFVDIYWELGDLTMSH